MLNQWNLENLQDNQHDKLIDQMVNKLFATGRAIDFDACPVTTKGAVVVCLDDEKQEAHVKHSKNFAEFIGKTLVGYMHCRTSVFWEENEERAIFKKKLLNYFYEKEGYTIRKHKGDLESFYTVEETPDFLNLGVEQLYLVFRFSSKYFARKGIVACFTNRFAAYDFVRAYKGLMGEAVPLLPELGENVPGLVLEAINRVLERPEINQLYNTYVFNKRRDNPDEKYDKMSEREFKRWLEKQAIKEGIRMVAKLPMNGKRVCKQCGEEKVHVFKTLSGKGRCKIFVDDMGGWWLGKLCPPCTHKKMKERNDARAAAWREVKARQAQEAKEQLEASSEQQEPSSN